MFKKIKGFYDLLHWKIYRRFGDTYKFLFWITLIGFILLLVISSFLIYDSKKEYEELSFSYAELLNNSKGMLAPSIKVYNRTVMVSYKSLDGDISSWEVPFSSLESSIIKGQYRREFMPKLFLPLIRNLCSTSDCSNFVEDYNETISKFEESSLGYTNLTKEDGSKYFVVDFRPFIDSGVFDEVINELYVHSKSEEDFIIEVWNIVTQLNTYSDEIEETPRYPLETFLAGGGDCEDTSILFASMIQAAPIEWNLSFLYMDLNNPENPEQVNHVLVFIETENNNYSIETTSNYKMEPFENVKGWYLKI